MLKLCRAGRGILSALFAAVFLLAFLPWAAPVRGGEAAAEPSTEAAAEETSESMTEPAAEPVTEPAAEPVTRPAAEPPVEAAPTGFPDLASAAVTFAAEGCGRAFHAWAPPEMRVTAIDFGQSKLPGDVILLSSGGHHLLMDTGLPDDREDPDNCATIRYLRENGISDLDLYLSHDHDDHYFLMCTIMEDPFFHVGRIYLPEAGTLLQYSDPVYQWEPWYASLTKNLSVSGSWGANARSAILADAQAREIPVTILTKGDSFTVGFARVEILWQDTDNVPAGDNATDAINRSSLVAMVTGGGCRYLTGGDMYVSNEERILEAGIDVRADIFKLSHHGGETSNCEAFLAAVSPRYAILEDYPHRQLTSEKSERAVRAVQAAGAVVMSPRRHGTFTYVCRDGEISVLGGERNREEWDLP